MMPPEAGRSAAARAAWGGFLEAARAIAGAGRFDELADAEPFGALNSFFRTHGVQR